MQHHSPAFLLTSDLRERWVPTRSELIRRNKKRLRSPFVLPSAFNIIIMIDYINNIALSLFNNRSLTRRTI